MKTIYSILYLIFIVFISVIVSFIYANDELDKIYQTSNALTLSEVKNQQIIFDYAKQNKVNIFKKTITVNEQHKKVILEGDINNYDNLSNYLPRLNHGNQVHLFSGQHFHVFNAIDSIEIRPPNKMMDPLGEYVLYGNDQDYQRFREFLKANHIKIHQYELIHQVNPIFVSLLPIILVVFILLIITNFIYLLSKMKDIAIRYLFGHTKWQVFIILQKEIMNKIVWLSILVLVVMPLITIKLYSGLYWRYLITIYSVLALIILMSMSLNALLSLAVLKINLINAIKAYRPYQLISYLTFLFKTLLLGLLSFVMINTFQAYQIIVHQQTYKIEYLTKFNDFYNTTVTISNPDIFSDDEHYRLPAQKLITQYLTTNKGFIFKTTAQLDPSKKQIVSIVIDKNYVDLLKIKDNHQQTLKLDDKNYLLIPQKYKNVKDYAPYIPVEFRQKDISICYIENLPIIDLQANEYDATTDYIFFVVGHQYIDKKLAGSLLANHFFFKSHNHLAYSTIAPDLQNLKLNHIVQRVQNPQQKYQQFITTVRFILINHIITFIVALIAFIITCSFLTLNYIQSKSKDIAVKQLFGQPLNVIFKKFIVVNVLDTAFIFIVISYIYHFSRWVILLLIMMAIIEIISLLIMIYIMTQRNIHQVIKDL